MMNVLLVLCACISSVSAHGRLWDPVGRSTAWRIGFNTPPNYDDTALFCGGFSTQQHNGGKCGVCGDPYNGRRDNEPPHGKYATGTIVKTYKEGQIIHTDTEVTANHFGWMEYKICPHNDVTTPVTQDCLDQHVLQRADGLGTRVNITTSRTGHYEMDYLLPPGMTCTQCVIQWKYHTGNSWGVDPVSKTSCVGCGPQEEFYACADVAIESNNGVAPPPLMTVAPPRTVRTTTPAQGRPTLPDAIITINPGALPVATVQPTSSALITCYAINMFADEPQMDQWCKENCQVGRCPPLSCECTTTPTPSTTSAPTTAAPTTPAPTTPTPTTPTPTTTSTTTTRTTPTTTIRPTTRPTSNAFVTEAAGKQECKAINLWAGNGYLDRWCTEACATGNCPSDSCACSTVQIMTTKEKTTPQTEMKVTNVCLAIGKYAGIEVFDQWCDETCNTEPTCPADICSCTNSLLVKLPTSSPTTTPRTPPAATQCTARDGYKDNGDYWKDWCQQNCDRGYCAVEYCICP